MKKALYLVIFLLLTQQSLFAKFYDELSMSFKNDALFGKDQDYTSGLEFSYKKANSDLTYYLGQDIYTPEKKDTTIPIAGEHPYGAWLYIGVSKKVQFDNLQNDFKISIGTIGKNAKGKSSSNSIHKIIGASKEKGWDTQVHKSIAYNISLKSFYDPLNFKSDGYTVKPYFVADVGNVFTDYGLGLSVDTDINNFLNLYAMGERRQINKNIFLEGENKNGSTQYSVDKINHKNIITLGLETTYVENYNIVFEMIFNSKEYKTQTHNNNYSMIKVVKKF